MILYCGLDTESVYLRDHIGYNKSENTESRKGLSYEYNTVVQGCTDEVLQEICDNVGGGNFRVNIRLLSDCFVPWNDHTRRIGPIVLD